MLKVPALVLFLIFSGAASKPSSPTQAFTDRELQCFAEEKVLYKDDKCYKLRTRGPCQDGQWLIYEDTGTGNSRPETVCRVRVCNTGDKPIFWRDDGQCHKRTDRATLCPYGGNMLTSGSYGDGICACDSNHARYETDVLNEKRESGEWPGEGVCYPLFYRGPCPPGKIFHPYVLKGFGLVARCFEDLCASLNNGSDPTTSYVMRPEDSKCYKLGTTGTPCAPSEVFKVHTITHLPACYSTVTSLFTSANNERCGGVANINTLTGKCRDKVIFKAMNFGYEITRMKRATRRKG